MSFFDTNAPIDDDTFLPSTANGFWEGPTPGFGASFVAAYNESAHVMSSMGAEADMGDLERQQLDKIYDATGERLSPIFGVWASRAPSYGVIRGLAGDPLSPQDVQAFNDAQTQISKVTEVARQHPGEILDYDQMWKQVYGNAQATAATAADTQARQGFTGELGSFLGGAAGSLTYRDPINIMSLALGGFGKSAAARVASEMGAAGLGQAVDLLTGSYENQKVLGEAPTEGQMAAQVLTTAAGAGVARGAGEVIGTGFRALAKRFGARAPDITAGAIAQEAEDVLGPSPYGDSRVAQGLHEAEVKDAIDNDVPLNMAARAPDPLNFAVAPLASRDSDALFAGTSTPLDRLFGQLPGDADFGRTGVGTTNKALTDLTGRVAEADRTAEELTVKAQAAQDGLVPTEAVAEAQARLNDMNQQIAQTTTKRELGRLTKAKADIEAMLGDAQAKVADLTALAGQRDAAVQGASDLRLKRAAIVVRTARSATGIKRSAVAKMLAETLGQDGAVASDVRPRGSIAAEAEATVSAPEKPPRQPKIIPAPEPTPGVEPVARPEAGQPGSGETVDVGQHGAPVDLDTEIVTGKDEDGKPVYSSIRDILKEHADDDALVQNMKACLL